MGKKYIIELEEPEMFDDRKFYTCSQMPWWAVSENIVENLTPYTEPDLEQVNAEKDKIYDEARDRGYEEGKARGYQEGLFDAWEAARKILSYGKTGGKLEVLTDVFSDADGWWDIINKYTASEVIEKIRQYEQEQEEIKVGDEVRNVRSGWTAVVARISDDECLTLMDGNGAIADGYEITRFTKTGRRFPELVELLRKMKEES